MTAYLSLYLIAFLGALFDGSPKYRSFALIFAAILAACIFLIIGTRFEIGADWGSYLEIFYSANTSNIFEAIAIRDPLYMAINYLSLKAGFGILGVNLVCALVFSIGLFGFAYSLRRPLLAILVSIPYIVIVVAMGYSRQGAALGLIFFSIPYLRSGKALKPIALVILAAMLHKPAIIVAPFFALAAARSKFASLLICGTIAALGYLVVLRESLDAYVYIYVDGAYSSGGAAIRISLLAFPAALFLIFRKRWGFEERELRFWTSLSYLAITLIVLVPIVPFTTALDRIAVYLCPIQILVFSSFPSIFFHSVQARTLGLFLVVAFWAVLLLGWLTLTSYSANWLPYKSYLFL